VTADDAREISGSTRGYISVKKANKRLLPEDMSQEIIIWGIVTEEKKIYSRVCMGPKAKLHYY
jgi:hypothetical protein